MSAFWEYNKQLFLRILTAGLYSTVLYSGLCTAIVSANVLFNLDLDGKIYLHLGYCVYGIFNTAFFLAGVPADWYALETEQIYPKGLKVFTQFVLIPLAIIYLCILLAYECKVIIEWSLPKGLVSSLVLGYAVYGILSILLVHPIRHNEGNKWIKTFSRLFYVLLVPLILLLSVAVWARINQYGITEARYILIVLSLWLSGITVYFIFSTSQNIKIIPVSLCMLTLLCIWGPQSASSISLQSQMSRLIALFEKNKAYASDKFSPLPTTITKEDSDEASEIVSFIVERHGIDPFRDHMTASLDTLQHYDTLRNRYDRNYKYISTLRDMLGIRNITDDYLYYTASADVDTVRVSDFDYISDFQFPDYTEPKKTNVFWSSDSTSIIFKSATDTIHFSIEKIFNEVTRENPGRHKAFASSELNSQATTERAYYSLVLKFISFNKQGDRYTLQSCDGYILIKH